VAEGHCEVPPWVPVFLLFIFYCPALPLPLPLPCPVSNLPFAVRDRRRKLHRKLFFLLLPWTGGGSYTGNSSSSSPVGGSAPLDSATVGGGVMFDGSLVAEMDETSVQLDG